jgi:sulfite reductase (ferredoxin)
LDWLHGGGGGNTVRNIIASHNSGVSVNETFDVIPYANELTSRMIAEEDSWKLPRKYKIAFANSDRDNIKATMADLGFIAKLQGEQKGFKVYCAGGMGARSEVGKVLFNFVPDTYVYHIAKALKIMFDKNGNRRQKHNSRIRFLWNDLGENRFKELFFKEYDALINAGTEPLRIKQIDYKDESNNNLKQIIDRSPEFKIWKNRYVKRQKQKGLYQITVPLNLGDISSSDIYVLTDLLQNFGNNCLRYTIKQNIYLINIPEKYLGNLFNTIKRINTLSLEPVLLGNMVACTGADTCKLGICLPKGLVPEIHKTIKKSNLNIDSFKDIKINISGCPNSCGCHQTANLGFFGKVIKKEGELLPAYNIVIGGVLGDEKTSLAKKVAEIPAKDIPEFIQKILIKFDLQKTNGYSRFSDYIKQDGKQNLINLAKNYVAKLKSYNETPEYYHDWSAMEKFTVLKGQKPECTAGLYDMIEVDMKMMLEYKEKLKQSTDNKNDILAEIVFLTSRMLLITRGIEPRGRIEVYENFLKHFIETGIVSAEFRNLIEKQISGEVNLIPEENVIVKLCDTIVGLYKNMDDSLQFNTENIVSKSRKTDTTNVRKRDFRNVACPMNFVKTKIELSTMKSGEILEILLDDGQPIQNVPGSVKAEGHIILEQTQIEEYWSVLIQKG